MGLYFTEYKNLGNEENPVQVAFYKDDNGEEISDKTLNERKIAIPFTPTYRTYQNLVAQGLWKVAK